jgi:hypothetical protein
MIIDAFGAEQLQLHGDMLLLTLPLRRWACLGA